MDKISNILAFLGALPRLLTIFEKLGDHIQKNKDNNFITDLSKAVDLSIVAEKPEDKREALRAWLSVYRRIGS